MRGVLHDWPAEVSFKILGHLHDAMKDGHGSHLLINEHALSGLLRGLSILIRKEPGMIW